MRSVNRVLIETTVRRALKNIQDSPERSFRNLVDLGLTVLYGRFTQHFLNTVQEMLQSNNSAYFQLIRDIVSNVNHDNLVKFGVNIGYNGCTLGAKKIREIEAEQNFDIPWSIFLDIDVDEFAAHEQQYDSLISQGEELGIYTWILWMPEKIYKVLPLIEKHSDCAFVLCCLPESIDASTVEDFSSIDNLMIAVRYGEDASDACALLRENHRLYSVYVPYSEDDAPSIENGEIYSCTEVVHPAFTILKAEKDCPIEIQKQIYTSVEKARESQKYQTVPWDACYDNQYIDSIISDSVCSAGVDRNGCFISLCDQIIRDKYNVFTENLKDVLKAAFPKKHVTATP